MISLYIFLIILLIGLLIPMLKDWFEHPEYAESLKNRKKRRRKSSGSGSIHSNHPVMKRYDAEHNRR